MYKFSLTIAQIIEKGDLDYYIYWGRIIPGIRSKILGWNTDKVRVRNNSCTCSNCVKDREYTQDELMLRVSLYDIYSVLGIEVVTYYVRRLNNFEKSEFLTQLTSKAATLNVGLNNILDIISSQQFCWGKLNNNSDLENVVASILKEGEQ
jgi:hypothetical protein